MKDKEKQIEEMAKDIYEQKSCDTSFEENCKLLAYDLVTLGYQKVDKNSVVLTRKEWKNLQEEKNDYKQRFESSEKRYEQLVQSSCEALEKKSKETAQEILRRFVEFSENPCNSREDILKELAKQFGVEIKE